MPSHGLTDQNSNSYFSNPQSGQIGLDQNNVFRCFEYNYFEFSFFCTFTTFFFAFVKKFVKVLLEQSIITAKSEASLYLPRKARAIWSHATQKNFNQKRLSLFVVEAAVEKFQF